MNTNFKSNRIYLLSQIKLGLKYTDDMGYTLIDPTIGGVNDSSYESMSILGTKLFAKIPLANSNCQVLSLDYSMNNPFYYNAYDVFFTRNSVIIPEDDDVIKMIIEE